MKKTLLLFLLAVPLSVVSGYYRITSYNVCYTKLLRVLEPLKVTITNLPQEEIPCSAANHPQKPELGDRSLTLTREIFIERDDFMEDPPNKS